MFAAQAPVVEYIAPALGVSYTATAPIVEYLSQVPAGFNVAPAPVVYAAQAPVVEYIAAAPAVYAAQAPVVEYIAPVPAVYAAQAPHCASTGILLKAFKKSPAMYVAIQTLLSLYGLRERSAVCTRVDAVSVKSFSGPSFLGGGVATTSGQQHHPSSMPVDSLIPFFHVASVQTFRAHSRLVRIFRFISSVVTAHIPSCPNEQQQQHSVAILAQAISCSTRHSVWRLS